MGLWITRLYWVWLKGRGVLGQELLAGIGLAVGVALLFASLIASTSLDGSVRSTTSELVGKMQFQLDARGSEGFDQQMLGEVRGLPGVRLAVPVLQEPVTVTGPAGQRAVELIGIELSGALSGSPLSRHFEFAGGGPRGALVFPLPVAESVGVHSRSSLKLWFAGRTVTALFGHALDAEAIGGLVGSSVAVAPLAYAQRLTGMRGRITRVFVEVLPGHDRDVRGGLLRLAGRSLNVEPAGFDATLFGIAAAPANQSQGLFSGISALVGFLFAFNAMLLTLPMRGRLIRTLRVNGATKGDIIKVLTFGGLVLGVWASLLGLILGDVLSLAVFRSNPGYLALAFPVGSQRIVTWPCIAIAAGAGLFAAWAGVLSSLWQSSLDPARASISSKQQVLRARSTVVVTGGLVCLVLTTIVLIASPRSAVLGSVSLVLALLSLLPSLLNAIVGAFDRLQACFGSAATRIAVIELRSPKTWPRSVAIAAIGGTAVFGAVALDGAKANLQSGLDHAAHDVAGTADLWIVPSARQDVLATTPFRQDGALRIGSRPGVREVGAYRASFLDYGDRRVWVLAPPMSTPDPLPPSQIVAGKLALATARLHAGGWAVVSQALAEQHRLHIGRSFTLPSPQPMTYRLAAVSTNLGWPPGAIILNPRDYARAWGSTELSAYSVMVTPGASTESVRDELLRAIGSARGLVVETARQREQRMRMTSRQGLSRLGQITRLVLLAAVLAMSTAMGAMIRQRRPQLARLKVQGYRRGVLWRALIYESVLLLGAGCIIGTVFGVYGQLLISHALATVTGFPIVFSAGVGVAFLTTAVVGIAAVAVVALFGYRAASVAPKP